MIVQMIEGHTRIVGVGQGYTGLPIHDDVAEEGVPCMVTSWAPTPDELYALMSGANVHISILGTTHPPISVGVGSEPEDVPPNFEIAFGQSPWIGKPGEAA